MLADPLASPQARQQTSMAPVRMAIVGCGAIVRDIHLPVLAGHPEVRLTALVDRDLPAAQALAKSYGVPTALADARELDERQIDAALIATPPAHHASLAIDLAQRGCHVFVEKPMALTTAEAAAMVAAAEQARIVLAVGLFRRLYPSSRLVRAILASGRLGRPVAFDVEEGYVLDWPSVTLGSMRKESAGGGVLIDTGSHTLDQLLSFFPGPAELVEYRDNSLGGIESDCELRLRLTHTEQPIEGRVELSRTRKLRNTFRIECERGVVELSMTEREQVSIHPHDGRLIDSATDQVRRSQVRVGWEQPATASIHDAFRAEIDDWVNAIHRGKAPILSGATALPVVRLIGECYDRSAPLCEPWVEEGLSNRVVNRSSAPPVTANQGRRVLVTGATGFIGCRAVEMLSLRDGWTVRALVHNPGNAGRLARLPVEMVQGDVRHPEELARAVAGCDAVVHCAYGTTWGRRRELYAVTVEGTRHLVEAARAAGVRRFVHLSTTALHPRRGLTVWDEASPVEPRGDYAINKAQAERVVARAVERGLSAAILRLTHVYGPFSGPFTLRPVECLRQGTPVLLGNGEAPSNTVYVDNVAHAIALALEAPDEAARGQTFTISDDDDVNWATYHAYYARALGTEMRSVPGEEFERRWAEHDRRGLRHWATTWLRAGKEITTGAEAQALARKILQTDPIGRLPRAVLERFPRLRNWLRRRMRMDKVFVYRPEEAPPPPVPELELLELYGCPARACIDKARKLLHYQPVVSRERAMELTLAWLHQARLI